jgi:hypothetical protein
LEGKKYPFLRAKKGKMDKILVMIELSKKKVQGS